MDRVSVSCVLLLLCSVSGDVLQDTQTGQINPEPSLSELDALVREMSTKITENSLKIQQLQTLNDVGQVAFTLSLLASGHATTGPFNTETLLVFKHVISNIGQAYNPNTGFFTAPVTGAYHFEFYIYAQGGAEASGVVLKKNGETVCMAYEHQTNGQSKSANGATLQLEAADVVSLHLSANTVVFDNPNHHSTFSGHLLFPMQSSVNI